MVVSRRCDEKTYIIVIIIITKGHIEQELQPKTQQGPTNGTGSTGGGGGGGGKGNGTASTKDEATAAPRAEHHGEPSEAEQKSPEEQQAHDEEEVTRIREEDAEKLYQSELCEMPEAKDPRLFVEGLTLRRYQRQALAWMIQREKRRYVTEEDCTGLSMGTATAAATAAAAAGGAAEAEPAAEPPPPGETGNDRNGDSSGGESVSIRDGYVTVASWSQRSATNGVGDADCGGGAGVAMHPLWERRAAASRASRTAPASTSSEWGMFGAGPGAGAVPAGGAEEQESALSQPEAFYVNVYSRRFQKAFPPATLGCRGGVLADEMGMGKVRGSWRGSVVHGFSRFWWSCSVSWGKTRHFPWGRSQSLCGGGRL